jgi:nucleotide-binding universal stress UspA family protein
MSCIVVGVDGLPPADATLAFALEEIELGSVSQAVAHQALCPLAIVRSAES